MPAALTKPHASDIYHLREAGTPRPLTADETRQLLWHFTRDPQLAAQLVEPAPKAALAIALGIKTDRLIDNCSMSWALPKVLEHLLAVAADTGPGPPRSRRARLCGGAFVPGRVRTIAQAGKDIPL